VTGFDLPANHHSDPESLIRKSCSRLSSSGSSGSHVRGIFDRFQGMSLTQLIASETHQAEQDILAHPSNGKKMPMSRISSDAILNKLRNRLSGSALTTVPCILGPFKVHHALCDWGASMNILPKMVYDCLDKDPLVPTLMNCDWQTPL
jgi:hypothetical protein